MAEPVQPPPYADKPPDYEEQANGYGGPQCAATGYAGCIPHEALPENGAEKTSSEASPPVYAYNQPTTAPLAEMPLGVTSVQPPAKYGQGPHVMQCPHCSSLITSSTTLRIGMFVWVMVGCMALAGLLFFPPLLLCCCIPCCVPACKDVIHHCPHCRKELGRFNHHM